jgi:hypothetical protein
MGGNVTRFFARIGFIMQVVVFVLNVSLLAAQEADQTQAALSSVPRFMTVNGVLTDHARRPLNGVVGVTFALYKDQAGGAPLWLETQNIQVDSVGGYTAVLGVTSAEGLPPDLFVSGQARWLGVRPQVFLAQEQPRALIVSVPYALKAADAETLGGMPLSAFVLAETGTKGEPGASSSAFSKSDDAPSVSAVSGTGTINYVAKWLETGGAGTLGNSSLVESGDGTNLSLGASGLSKLSVTGGVNAGIWLRYADQNMYVDSDLDTIFRVNGPAGLPEAMRIASNGNVGIGTPAPAGGLDVRHTNSWFGSDFGARLNATGSVHAGIWLRYADHNMYVDSDAGTIFRVNAPSGLPEVMRITPAGNIGVGTANPAGKLEIAGNVKISAGGALGFTDGSTLTSANPVAAARIRGITYLAGCDTCSPLTDNDDQKTIYFNVVGPMTINEVRCFSDVGTPTINIQRDDGTPGDILASPLECSTAGALASSIVLAESVLDTSEKLDFKIIAAGGTAKRLTVIIKTTVN